MLRKHNKENSSLVSVQKEIDFIKESTWSQQFGDLLKDHN